MFGFIDDSIDHYGISLARPSLLVNNLPSACPQVEIAEQDHMTP